MAVLKQASDTGFGGVCNSMLAKLHQALTGRALPACASRDGEAAIFAFLVAMLAFGFELTNPSLGIDDYIHLGKEVSRDTFWIGRGMWGGLLVQHLLPGGWITPFITLVIGIGLQVLMAVMIGWIIFLNRAGFGMRVLLYSMFVTFPYFAAQMAFSYLQVSYPLASLLGVTGILMALSPHKLSVRTIVASIPLAFAVSVYQGSLSITLTLAPVAIITSFLIFRHSFESEIKLLGRYIANMMVAVVGGMVLYLITHKLVLGLTGVTPKDELYSVSFNLNFWDRWELIYPRIHDLFLGSSGLIPNQAVIVFWFIAGLAILAYIRFLREPTALIAGLVLIFCVIVGPFAIFFVHEGLGAPRSSLGISIAWFTVFTFTMSATLSWIRKIATTMAIVVVIIFIFQDNRIFYSQFLVAQADRILISRIAERIDSNPLTDTGENPVVVIVGLYRHPTYPAIRRHHNSVLGFSNFEWDRGAAGRILSVARSIGADRYIWRSEKVLGSASDINEIVHDRRPWPSAESVFLHDDKVVVWLGNPN